MPYLTDLSCERLREQLTYDPATGGFFRLSPRGYGPVKNLPAKTGHISISVLGRSYLAHRLAWLYMTGSWPEHVVDHKDGNASNNRFDNLRDVPQKWNLQNWGKPRGGSPHVGVHWHALSQRWRSVIRVEEGKRKHLGMFDSAEEARDAYLVAKRIHHPGCIV